MHIHTKHMHTLTYVHANTQMYICTTHAIKMYTYTYMYTYFLSSWPYLSAHLATMCNVIGGAVIVRINFCSHIIPSALGSDSATSSKFSKRSEVFVGQKQLIHSRLHTVAEFVSLIN